MNTDLQKLPKEELISRCILLQSRNTELETSNTELETKVENQQIRIDWFIRQYFGTKSEKVIQQDPRQMTFFDALETPPSKPTTVKQYERITRTKETVTG